MHLLRVLGVVEEVGRVGRLEVAGHRVLPLTLPDGLLALPAFVRIVHNASLLVSRLLTLLHVHTGMDARRRHLRRCHRHRAREDQALGQRENGEHLGSSRGSLRANLMFGVLNHGRDVPSSYRGIYNK